ncbi:hypothetical protein [Anaerolinea thermophila]|uniref:Exostosin GT47 domain-containing protein n=2 Tax=Anaerolinea TaxID=233189 RepID=E8N096_ANATU|nr:hypothetical protein [Anaerolinea thermophila]BAJ64645.1 hypothetical protein ANT_26190 [Anaerolinea thermophila UNI-1]
MKVYADYSHYHGKNRYFLNNIHKALWNDRSPEERDQVYGNWWRGFESVPNVSDADVVLLTNTWNYYLDHGLISQAEEEIRLAQQHKKKIVVFCGGDAPANLIQPNVILFEMGGYRSVQGLAYHSGIPFFLRDLLTIYCGGQLQFRTKPEVPVLGFCGQSDSSFLFNIFRKTRNLYQKLLYRLGLRKWQPPPFETVSFRRRVLHQFEGSGLVKTNFRLRRQYHAGNNRDKSDFSPQRLDFIQNILNSDYTVCIRGGGNFSIRFYETLSLGKIPIFVDTDCLLPFPDKIPYQQIFPWINVEDLPRAAEIVADFHSRLSNQDFIHLQRMCRQLWEEHFTPNGFYKDFQEKVYEII